MLYESLIKDKVLIGLSKPDLTRDVYGLPYHTMGLTWLLPWISLEWSNGALACVDVVGWELIKKKTKLIIKVQLFGHDVIEGMRSPEANVNFPGSFGTNN